MRATEFITETNAKKSIRKNMKASGVHAKRYDNLDSFYDMYRLGVAMADGNAPSEGPIGSSPTVWVRNKEEAEILAKAERAVGAKGTVVVPKGASEEIDDVQVHSPVATIKKNKYGV